MTIQIHNTLTRRVEPLVPIEPGHVRMYVCGMTVYDLCHLGHARTFIAFDLAVRWLRARGLRVTYVRNITDVEDKIIRRAAERGVTPAELTEDNIRAMHEDFAALGLLPPDLEPRATQYIPQMLDLIGLLEKKELAYQADADGDVVLCRAQVRRLRQAVRQVARRPARGRARGGRRQQARPARLRAVEARQARRAAVAVALGAGPARMAHRMLGDGERDARPHLRHPRRRAGPRLSAPRERNRAERRRL